MVLSLGVLQLFFAYIIILNIWLMYKAAIHLPFVSISVNYCRPSPCDNGGDCTNAWWHKPVTACYICYYKLFRKKIKFEKINVFGVGLSCRNLYSFVVYLYVNGSGPITSVGEERANCLLLFTCHYMVSVWRGFLFLWVLGMGYVILLWHSLRIPYNY